VGTSKNQAVYREADMEEDITENGDSGGLFIDTDGYLVATVMGDSTPMANTSIVVQ
jgi:hypothetical protein